MAEALSADLRDERGAALKRRKVLDEGRDRKLEANVDELCRAIKEWVSELRSTNERHYDKLAYMMYDSRAYMMYDSRENTEEVLVRTQRYLRYKEEEILRTHRRLLHKEEELLRTHRCLLDKEEELLRTRRCLLDKEEEHARIRTDLFVEARKTGEHKIGNDNQVSVPISVGFRGTTPRVILQNKQTMELKKDNDCLPLAEKKNRSYSTVMGSPDATPGVVVQSEQNHNKHAITDARSDNEDKFAKTAAGAGAGGRLRFNRHGNVKWSSAQMHVQGTSRGDAYDMDRALIHEVGMRVCELCQVKVHLNDFENHRQGRRHKHRCAVMGA